VADRTDFYFKQKVTEAELDLAFTLMEQAVWNLTTDIGVQGIVAGAVPAQHAPIANLTIDLTAPASAYDKLGERIYFGTGQTVDCSVDASGVPTAVVNAGNERSLGVFLQFNRQLSDPRTDGNSQQVYFRRSESFQFVVRQGPEAPIGTSVPVALVDNELLVCDVKRLFGQTQIVAANLDLHRRQTFIFAQAGSVAVQPGLWKTLAPAVATVQASLDATDAVFNDHLSGNARRHPATAIDFAPHGFLASKTVAAALGELVDDLSAAVAPAGTSRIGGDGLAGLPTSIPPGTLRTQLAQLLAALNAHLTAAAGAHAASAIGAAPFGFVTGGNVQAQLQSLVGGLAAVAGATLVGSDAVGGKPFALGAGMVRDQLVATLGFLNQFIGNLAGLALGQGAYNIGNIALGGNPKNHAAAPLQSQMQGLCDDMNAHIPSGDHDNRYLRSTYTNGQVYSPGQTIQHGNIGAWPAVVTTSYATPPPSGQTEVGPYTSTGALSNQIIATVTKPSGTTNFNLAVQNLTTQSLYIIVSVCKAGA